MRPSKQTGLEKKQQPTETKNIPVKLREIIRTKAIPEVDERVSRKKKCLICKQDWSVSQIEHLRCGHEFCYQCLHCYVNFKCLVGMEFKCPCCDKPMEEDTWKDRSDDHLRLVIDLIANQKDLKNNKICMQGEEKCTGIINLKGARFQCPKCKTEFCFQCLLPKHNGDCRANYLKQNLQWKRCPECNLFRDPVNVCTHFSCELEQKYCLVCIAGWSDRYFHQCTKESDPPPKQIWFRQSIMSSSWFLNILLGILFTLGFPLFFGLIFGVMLLAHVIAVVIALVAMPFMALYQGCSEGQWVQMLFFFLCFPCGEILGVASITSTLWQDYTKVLPGTLITYILTNKSLFYYTLPYRQNPGNYTSFQIRSTARRVLYLVIMLVLLPFMLVLPIVFFLMSALCVFVFTLLSLPVVAMKVKGIPVWVSLVFFPIVFFHFVSLEYISKFMVGQIKQLLNFYKYYFLTMAKYLTCEDNVEDNSCVEPLEQARLASSNS